MSYMSTVITLNTYLQSLPSHHQCRGYIGLFHFLSVQGDGRKIPGLVKSMNFQRSTAKSPKIPGGWQHFATKFIEIEIFTLTDFSRQSCRCKQEFQGKKGKIFSRGIDWRIVLPLNPPGTQER